MGKNSVLKAPIISLYFDKIEQNKDGTFTVYWGYNNRDVRRLELTDNDSYLYIRKGGAITYPEKPPTVFKPGNHSNCFKTIIVENTDLIWKVKKAWKQLSYKDCQQMYLDQGA
ncbi:MAG: hypothetical protein RSA96_06265 [Erysipelotrichaceae bacterium]